ncbi:hypothetical protein BDZ91DRAFT_731175 [Kalaharituber pfeilii]|nr:hypothetical protein BDZ91DRAFT_731175 [Kalaharituber pfeilii]
MISIETPLPLLRTIGLNQVVSVCSFRVCCWYECSPFASRHLHCWRLMNLNRLLIYF